MTALIGIRLPDAGRDCRCTDDDRPWGGRSPYLYHHICLFHTIVAAHSGRYVDRSLCRLVGVQVGGLAEVEHRVVWELPCPRPSDYPLLRIQTSHLGTLVLLFFDFDLPVLVDYRSLEPVRRREEPPS